MPMPWLSNPKFFPPTLPIVRYRPAPPPPPKPTRAMVRRQIIAEEAARAKALAEAETRTRRMRVSLIVATACAHFGVSREELRGLSRAKPLFAARVYIAHRLKRELGFSLPQTGVVLNRHHTTILNMLRHPFPAIPGEEPPDPNQADLFRAGVSG